MEDANVEVRLRARILENGKIVSLHAHIFAMHLLQPLYVNDTSKHHGPLLEEGAGDSHNGQRVPDQEPHAIVVARRLPHFYRGLDNAFDMAAVAWAFCVMLLEPRDFPKGGGLRPPPFGRVSRASGAAQTPKMIDFQSLNKSTIFKPSLSAATLPQGTLG